MGTCFVIKSNLNCFVRVGYLSGYIFLGLPWILNNLCWILSWILWLFNFTYQRKFSKKLYQLRWSTIIFDISNLWQILSNDTITIFHNLLNYNTKYITF